MIVSNAAVNPSVDAILETKESVLDKLWDINVKASILLLQVSQLIRINPKFANACVTSYVLEHLS